MFWSVTVDVSSEQALMNIGSFVCRSERGLWH